MRIEAQGDHWIIVRGQGRNEQSFCFYVDADRSCWTKTKTWMAARFQVQALAQVALDELKRRARERRTKT
jgi:hypothetical protein